MAYFDFAFSLAASPLVSFSTLSRPLSSNPPAAPGVLGVLTDPNEANAPDPKPKAEDALAEGEFVARGETVLKGFDFPWEEESPIRRLLAKLRGESVLLPSLLSPPIDRESLLALVVVSFAQRISKEFSFSRSTYLDLRVHKFAFSMRVVEQKSIGREVSGTGLHLANILTQDSSVYAGNQVEGSGLMKERSGRSKKEFKNVRSFDDALILPSLKSQVDCSGVLEDVWSSFLHSS